MAGISIEPRATETRAVEPRTSARSDLAGGWLPTFADWAFVAVLVWLFSAGQGAQSLLADGDAGWHIRLGESFLATGRLPATDPFSFTMEGRVWFAWEWLADVIFGAAHQLAGLKAVAWLAGALIAGSAWLLLRFLLWRGVNLFIAVGATMLVCGVSTVHWLARPHVFTWPLMIATLWLLDADRRAPSKRVWWLVPLTAVWVNLHGGFLAAPISVAVFGAGVVAERFLAGQRFERNGSSGLHLRWFLPREAGRYAALLAGVGLATLANPYGWELHLHIAEYLQSDFILEHVQEFQSPRFRSEAMTILEVAIFGSLVLGGRMALRGEIAWPLLAAAWAHASLTSVRHAPLFMLVAAPLLGRELTLLLEAGARRGVALLETLEEIAKDYGGARGAVRPSFGVWLPVAAVIGLGWMLAARADEPRWRAEFPAIKFPVAAADALGERMVGRRVLTTDQWGDYLVYRYYPDYKTFIDGRSDFYDPEIRDDYMDFLGAHWSWERLLDKYRFDAVLAPREWPLASALKGHAGWRLVYDDGQSAYFERRPGAISRRAPEGSTGGREITGRSS